MSWPPESYQTLHSWPSVFTNFSKLSTANGHAIYSSPFMIGVYEFKILIYPGGNTADDKDYVSLYLQMSKPLTATHLSFVLSIIDMDGTKYSVLKPNTSLFDASNKKNTYGSRKFAKRHYLLNEVLSVTNDHLIVLCEIVDLDMTESSYSLQRLSSYGKYLNNQQYSDVKIIVKRKTIHAHKVILISDNEVFAAMFNHDSKESRENVIRIRDIEFEVMLELVRFIYTGQVQNMEKIVKKLLIASDKYGVSELKATCSRYLSRLLTIDDVLELLSFADYYNADELRDEAVDFFLTHKKDIVKMHNFENTLKTLSANLIAEIITDLSNS